MDGFLIIAKPAEWTSHDVVAKTRNRLKIKKVGHSGTLDPIATGVLLLGLGKATRLIRFLPTDKTYIATITLGVETDTYDRAGQITQTQDVPLFSPDVIRNQLTEFVGEIDQQPPIYSAIKIEGKPLYKRARKGESIDIPHRQVKIYQIEVMSIELPEIKVEVRCSAGTYIRSLAHDLGQKLGCGAHLKELTRTQIGDFCLDQALPLDQVDPETIGDHLIPIDTALAYLPGIRFNAEIAQGIRQGRAPQWTDQTGSVHYPPETILRLKNEENELLAIATVTEGNEFRLERVL